VERGLTRWDGPRGEAARLGDGATRNRESASADDVVSSGRRKGSHAALESRSWNVPLLYIERFCEVGTGHPGRSEPYHSAGVGMNFPTFAFSQYSGAKLARHFSFRGLPLSVIFFVDLSQKTDALRDPAICTLRNSGFKTKGFANSGYRRVGYSLEASAL
jgi:hypothetical protein